MARRKKVDVAVTRQELNDPLSDLFTGKTKQEATDEMWAQEVVVEKATTALVGHPHLINSPTRALAFMLAGNATMTLRSKKTGTRFTYRVRANHDGAVHFVALLRGENNEGDRFCQPRRRSYFGYVRRGVFHHGGAKAKVEYDASSVKAFSWTFKQITQGEMSNQLEIWHEGRCGRCGRKLTVPESIASGIGPECAEKMGG
jgi:uncharacterized protein DUF6011